MWDVLSVGSALPNPAHCHRHAQVDCDDIVQPDGASFEHPRVPSADHVRAALAFAREAADAPLLIHCHMGLSRSPAIAWCILLQRLGSAHAATEAVFVLQPRAIPNRLLIRHGLEVLTGSGSGLTDVLAEMRNRSQHPLRWEYLLPDKA